MEYNASDLKFDLMTPDKFKVFFNIAKREDALKIYTYFTENRRIFNGLIKVAIFLQMPEDIFVRCADKFLETGEVPKEQPRRGDERGFRRDRGHGDGDREGRRGRDERGGHHHQQRHDFHRERTEEEIKKDIEAAGIQFTGERPKFTK